MTAEPRKPGAVWLTLGIVAALVLYPVLFGPFVWGAARGYISSSMVERTYRPILWAAVDGPAFVQKAIASWGSLGIPADTSAEFGIDWLDNAAYLQFWGPDDTASPMRMGLGK